MYKVFYLDSVEQDFESLDKQVRRRVLDKIENHLAKDPKGLGKPLTGPLKGLWRYRVGDFRVIYKIADKEILILIARVGHRKNIYRDS
ncbi:MAG: type II toxin-antitoxin system RelE/ParE family toxin [Candidatus Omnitrophica bacterium]|nr:type II toxin-antitoxin system RelE/ParE family toxin [Candidatus Omnitrophota bacterium]